MVLTPAVTPLWTRRFAPESWDVGAERDVTPEYAELQLRAAELGVTEDPPTFQRNSGKLSLSFDFDIQT